MLKHLIYVLKKPKYIGLILLVSIIIFSLIIFIQNIPALNNFLSTLGLIGTLKIFISMVMHSYTTVHGYVFWILALIAIVGGINAALFVELFRIKKNFLTKGDTSKQGIGLFFAVLGVGCASCGTLIIAPLLSVIGLGGLLTFLPFAGAEFLFIGLVFLLFSTYSLLKKFEEPHTCAVV